MWLLKFSAGLPLVFIALEDFKERRVHWIWFPILGALLGFAHFRSAQSNEVFFYHIVLNGLMVTIILGILLLVTRLVFKKPFIDHSLGLGDILFFYALALGFPTVTFIVLYAFSLLFALFVFLMFKKKYKLHSVPLAGLMASFLLMVLLISIVVETPSLYTF